MRIVLASVIFLLVGSTFNAARADPYPWCAVLNMGDAAYNCYFMTLQQCQATVSGIGGSCEPNQFYDGRPEGAYTKRPS
jgi:hypothetical protein